MHPRQMRETSRPVRPSLVYSILALLHPALPFRGEGSAASTGMGEAGVIGGSLYSPLEAISRGTEGSNPSPSSGESGANHGCAKGSASRCLHPRRRLTGYVRAVLRLLSRRPGDRGFESCFLQRRVRSEPFR